MAIEAAREGDVFLKRQGKLMRPKRLANGLYKFKEGSNIDRVVLDCITSLQNGADLLWIETPTPDLKAIAHMVNRIKAIEPKAKLVYNNSPSFNWTLNFRHQAYDAMLAEGENMTAYDRNNLMDEAYDTTELAFRADENIRTFQLDGAREAGIFHHLITLPTYHTTALHMDDLSKGYFGNEGMLTYVRDVQRQEIRKQVACVKHQRMAGSDLGDDHKTFFAGDKALKAGGAKNTSNQFNTSGKVKEIKKAEWDIEVPGYKVGDKEWLKSQVSRAFLPKYFPGYKKYLWIDCDAWVHDWSSVELYFKACEEGKLGITQTMGPGYRIMSKVKWLFGKFAIIKSQNFKHAISSNIGLEKARKLAFAPHINIGVFSLEENSPCWKVGKKI